MQIKRALLLSFSSYFVGSAAWAVVWTNTVTDQDVLNFGNDQRLRGVGWLVGSGTGTFLGTDTNGVAWGITAKHVAGQGATGTFQVDGGGSYAYGNTIAFSGADVSVFQIVGWNENLPNKRLYTEGVYTAGTQFISAGYGTHGPEDQSLIGFDQRRRGFQTVLDSFRPNDTSLWFEDQPFLIDRFDAPGSPNAQPLEGFGAPGDSGSPLIDTQDRIWGVLTDGQPERYGNVNWYATITPTLAADIYAATGIPVPVPGVLITFAGGAYLATRRRRAV
jgi:hypothetical protein